MNCACGFYLHFFFSFFFSHDTRQAMRPKIHTEHVIGGMARTFLDLRHILSIGTLYSNIESG